MSNARATACVLVGVLATAAMPVAVYGTRYFEQYELLHAGLAIPVALVLSLLALALGRAAKTQEAITLGRAGGRKLVQVGRSLALIGIWMGGACLVALAVYGLLEYQASR